MSTNDEGRSGEPFAEGGEEIVRHEEEIAGVDTAWRGIGHLRARKVVERNRVEEDVPRDVDQVDFERVSVGESDSGKIETLADGSISIPIFEEELVISKRTVLTERVIVRKQTVTETQRVQAELRRERVEFDTDGDVEVEGLETLDR